jgi:hypothetical protein
VLGLDNIEDESYRQYLLMYKPSEEGPQGNAKKYSLYPFGMSEKLFIPKA